MGKFARRTSENQAVQALKQLLQPIPESESQPFRKDYNQNVILPNSISLILYTCLAFGFYIMIEIIVYSEESKTLINYESKYLLDLQMESTLQSKSLFAQMQGFLGIYRQTLLLQLPGNGNFSICNQTRYFCENSPYQYIYQVIGDKYPLLQMVHNSLNFNIGGDLGEIFLYYQNQTPHLLQYRFGREKPGWIKDKVLPYVEAHKENTYLTRVLSIQDDVKPKLKFLLCGLVPILGNFSKICMISGGDLETMFLKDRTNPIKITDEHILFVSRDLVVENQQSLLEQESTMIDQIISQSVIEENKPFFTSFHFKDCIRNYEQIQDIISNKMRVCSPPQPVYVMTPLTILSDYEIQIYPRYYEQDLVSTAKAQNFTLNYVIYSNISFFQNESRRIRQFNKRQAYLTYILAAIITLWLFLMPLLPIKLVGGQLAQTVLLLIKMCRTVKMIKNKDDLQIQGEIFGKLSLEMGKKKHIFNSTIEYFKYFIWYRKWLFTTNSSKRKALLEQGLTLFGDYDYAPVLVYIYNKQIQRELTLAKHYKKMRKIFNQRFLIYQGEDRHELGSGPKGRIGGRKLKKSTPNKQELQEDQIESKDYCMIDNMDREFQNRINKQLQMMEVQKKTKRYVRFSNDLQQEDKPFQYRVSKFLLNQNPSQSSILKTSQKSIQEDIKRQDAQVGSLPYGESSREERDQESQFSQKNQDNWDMLIKFDQLDEDDSDSDNQDEGLEIKRFSLKKLDEKITPIYQNIVESYTSQIIIKKMYLQKQSMSEITEYINQIYLLEIQKLRYSYKCLKHKGKQREKMLKQLSRKLNNIKKEKRIKDFEKQKSLGSSQKWLQQTISVIQSQIIDDSKDFDLDFKNFTDLEEKYKIDPPLIERALLYQMKMLKIMNYPIPYKKLESLCNSNIEEIRVEAKVIMAAEFFHISPHADFQVLMKAQENLSENHTTHVQKQKNLKLIQKVLKNRQILEQQESHVELIKNYYNYVHKKFYFVADLTDSYENFRPTLVEIYKNMGQTDMFQIINLAMNQVIQDMIINGSQIKPSKQIEFETKFQNFYNELTKIKSLVSTKANGRRVAFEKDFNRILSKIEQEDINLSKYLVLILGGQNQPHSKAHEDFESSSAQNRQVYQVVHQEILTKMDRNYFHVILVGYNLKDYSTRQGKLKKYVRNTHDLIEIDLAKGNIIQQYKQLHKYLNK